MPSVIQIERVQTVHAILNSDQAVKISIAGVYISPPNPWNLKTANFMISRPVYDRQPESQGPTELGIVGSGSYEQSWRAIPTHRYGAEAPATAIPYSVHPIQSGIEVRPGTQVAYWRTQSTDSNRLQPKPMLFSDH